MVIPDWLAALLEKLGLKSSPVEQLRRKIAGYEDERREIKEQIKSNIQLLSKKKSEYQTLYPKFEAAQEPEKGLLAIELRSLKDAISNGSAEITELIQTKVKVLDTLIRKNTTVLFGMEHGIKTDEIEDTSFVVETMAEDLQEEVAALSNLNEVSITAASEPVFSVDNYADLAPQKTEKNYDDLKPINPAPVNTNTEYKA